MVREVWEETGLTIAEPGKHLGTWRNELADGERVTCRHTTLWFEASATSIALAEVGRGATLPFLEADGDFIKSSYYVTEGNSRDTVRGWIARTDLSEIKERHFSIRSSNTTHPNPGTSWQIRI